MEEVVHSIQGDFACDSLRYGIQNHVKLVPKHIKDGYGTEDFRRAQRLLHDDSLRMCQRKHQ